MKIRVLGLILVCFIFSGVWANHGADAADTPIKLIIVDMVPPVALQGQCAKWWGDEVMKRGQGKVKVEFYFGASLVGAYEQLSAVMNNVVQVTPYYSGYHPDIAPIPSMALFPLMNIKSLESGLKAADDFFRNNPEVQKEFAKNKVKYMNPLYGADAYMWSKVPLTAAAEFKGLTVRGFGPWLTLFTAMGSSMVSVPVPEIYNSLERGVVKSTVLYLSNGVGLNLFEVTNHLNITNLGHNCGMPMVMNLETWNKLPEDMKKVIDELNTKDAIPNFVRLYQQSREREMKLVKDKGMKLSEFTQPEVEKMIALAKEKVWMPYAKNLDQKGVNGTKTLDDLIKYVSKY